MGDAKGPAGAYDFPIDLENLNSVPAQLALRVPPRSRVLDVGCASGNLGGYLIRERGCLVVGVEKDIAAALAARAKGLDVRVIDLDQVSLKQRLPSRRFDRVILADVLEHLSAPEQVLQDAASLLRRRGRVLVSIPNISHIDVALALAHDRWEYRDSGLLDRTHIRFFTEATFRHMVESVGLAVEGMARLRLPPLHTELWSGPLAAPDPELVAQLARLTQAVHPNFDVYQFVFTLAPRARWSRWAPIGPKRTA